jgi:hypothetical protein
MHGATIEVTINNVEAGLPGFEAQFESVSAQQRMGFSQILKVCLPDMKRYLLDLKPCLPDTKRLLSGKRSKYVTHCTSALGSPTVMLMTLCITQPSCYMRLRRCIKNPADMPAMKYFLTSAVKGL